MGSGRHIARSAAIVMFAYILSNVVGMVKQMVVLNAFGISPQYDTFQAAFRLPDFLFNLIAGGALTSAFIPTYAGLLARDETAHAWRLASAIVNLILIVLIGAAALGAILAPQMVRTIIAPGFTPVQQVETAELVRVMLISSVIFGVSGLFMGVLNSHNHFLLPALAPILYQFGIIFGAVVLASPPFSMGIRGLAWGVVAGAAAHLLIQVPGLLQTGIRYVPTLDLHDPEVREVGRLMGPRVLGLMTVQINFWVNTILASYLSPGSLSAINTAFTILMLPEAAFGQALGIAAFPTLSQQAARGQRSELRHTAAEVLRGVLFFALPSAAGLFILSQPIIQAIFQRGAFDAQATREVAWALQMYAVGLIGHSLLEIVARTFYALHDTWTPVLAALGSMVTNILLSLAFISLFQAQGWMPHGGLALANSVATTGEMLILLFILRRRIGGLEGQQTLSELGRVSLAAAAMIAALLLTGLWLSDVSVYVRTLVSIALGAGVYFGAAMILRVDQVQLVGMLFRRLRPVAGDEVTG